MAKNRNPSEGDNILGLPERSRDYSLLWTSTRNFHRRIRKGANGSRNIWILYISLFILFMTTVLGFFR
jgi:hypothetical protein